MKDSFDTLPQGTVRSQKRGRIKPAPNPVISNLKTQTASLSKENEELKQRLADLEEAVSSLVSKKKK